MSNTPIQQFFREHGISEVEAVVPDMAGIARGKVMPALKFAEDFLDSVEGRQNQRNCRGRYRHAVAEFAHQGFGCMGQRLKARQAKESTGSLDRMDQPENVAQDRLIIGVLLKTNQFDVDCLEVFVRFRQEFNQKVIHFLFPSSGGFFTTNPVP